jgi:hypothetical protein
MIFRLHCLCKYFRRLTSRSKLDKKKLGLTLFTDTLTGSAQVIHRVFHSRMKIKQEQLDRLASLLLSNYKTKEIMVPKAAEAEIKAKIMTIINDNFAEEQSIEEEARKMLASYARASKDMDPFKMFLLAKQKLAAKKGFIL